MSTFISCCRLGKSDTSQRDGSMHVSRCLVTLIRRYVHELMTIRQCLWPCWMHAPCGRKLLDFNKIDVLISKRMIVTLQSIARRHEAVDLRSTKVAQLTSHCRMFHFALEPYCPFSFDISCCSLRRNLISSPFTATLKVVRCV